MGSFSKKKKNEKKSVPRLARIESMAEHTSTADGRDRPQMRVASNNRGMAADAAAVTHSSEYVRPAARMRMQALW